jgi:hypothetical protein
MKRPVHRLGIAIVALLFLGGVGCGTSKPEDPNRGVSSVSIPDDARTVDEGIGTLKYTAREDGRIFVMDMIDRAAIFDYHLNKGQDFELVPDRNRANVEGKRIYDKDLKRQHAHRLYFLSDDRRHRGQSSGLPPNSKMVGSGKGDVSYRAAGDGRAYVYDPDDQRVIVHTHLRDGQNLVVQPAQNRITVDSRQITGTDMSPKNEIRIYFEND